MDDQRLTQLSDNEILKRLESAEMADRLERDPNFKILREACRRMHDRGLMQLTTSDPSNYRRIMQLQVMCQFYDNILITMIRNFKKDGEAVFVEAVDAGLVKLPSSEIEKIGSQPR